MLLTGIASVLNFAAAAAADNGETGIPAVDALIGMTTGCFRELF